MENPNQWFGLSYTTSMMRFKDTLADNSIPYEDILITLNMGIRTIQNLLLKYMHV